MYRNIIRIIVLLLWANSAFAYTEITAQVVRNEAGSGETFISSGFPFPPGLVSESDITAGTIQVYVSEVEVAANVTALRGRHSDGSVRSALIQFTVADMDADEVISAIVTVDGDERTYDDPAYVRPTIEIVEDNNVILPTDPDYITTTFVTFQGLLPAGDEAAGDTELYVDYLEYMFDYLVITGSTGTASYDSVRGMLAMWARTGELKYFNQANTYIQTWLPYNTCNYACVADPYINPDDREGTNGSNALPNEQHWTRFYSYASMYLMTGYRDFWSAVAYAVQTTRVLVTDQTTSNTQYGTSFPRTNAVTLWRGYEGILVSYAIDATFPVPGGFYTARSLNWEEQFDWNLNSFETYAWDIEWIPFDSGTGVVPAVGTTITQGGVTSSLLAVGTAKDPVYVAAGEAMPTDGYLQITDRSGGSYSAGALTGISASATGVEEDDYRNGAVGLKSNVLTNDQIPIFQLSFPANYLIDYYLYVEQDSRIPAMVKILLDSWLENVSLLVSGDTAYGATNATWGDTLYGNTYDWLNPIGGGNTKTPWNLPDTLPRMIAFVLKTLGEDTVNGASYATWYTRATDAANIYPSVLTPEWKLFGQFFGVNQDTAWINDQVSLPAPTFREPTQYTSIPGDNPDLGRGYGVSFNQSGTINLNQTGTLNFNQ